jgi:hypothetical protein
MEIIIRSYRNKSESFEKAENYLRLLRGTKAGDA